MSRWGVGAPNPQGGSVLGWDPDWPAGPPNRLAYQGFCAEVKDNRILPHGCLGLDDRLRIAEALGAGRTLAEDAGSTAVGGDPDYVGGGGDRLVYESRLGRDGWRTGRGPGDAP